MEETILLIEDDKELGTQIIKYLRRAGFHTLWDTEGEWLLPGSLSSISLVILDLMLPETPGLDILKRLRTFSDVPVLVLSARNNTPDKVRALRLGADDYMTKPFWPEELMERVRARLRRPVMAHGEPVRFGPVTLDLGSRNVQVHGEPVELTKVEFNLLSALAMREGEAITRRWLVDHILDPDKDGTERTLDGFQGRMGAKVFRRQANGLENTKNPGHRSVPDRRPGHPFLDSPSWIRAESRIESP